MKIIHYAYDNIKNPYCGGGGSFREYTIHQQLSHDHTVLFYSGKYKGAKNHSDGNLQVRFLGWGINYLLSRITFSLFATVHSLFVKADVIVVGFSVFAPVLTFLARKNTVIEFYHITANEPFRKYGIFGIFPWIAEKMVLQFGKNFVTLTDSMADYITSNYKGKLAKAAYTGYDTSVDTSEDRDEKCILYFGRIDVHMKGIDILFDTYDCIAEEFAEYKLIFAGRGSEKDVNWLNERMNRSPFKDRVSFFRNVAPEKKLELFHGATIVCMPSRFEGWCIAAIEAAASGKATIGTQIMGLQDSIRHNETGLLVLPENKDELASAMRKLLNDPELRKRLGSQGRVWAKKFTWNNVTQLQYSVYCQSIGKSV
jgi:glycosyltransferase involved in cell wall biosynthesis